MHYKTIALELIQDRPEMYERLRSTKRLLPTMDAYAIELKTLHDTWKERIALANPLADPIQIASEAMEMAIQDLLERLPCESLEDEPEAISLDEMMTHLRHTPPA